MYKEFKNTKKNKDIRTRHWRLSGVTIVNLEYFTHCSSGSIVDFEQSVNNGWVNTGQKLNPFQ